MAIPDDSRFRRRRCGRELRKWLIVSEDSKSSLDYLKRFLTRQMLARFDFKGGEGDSLSVVERGIELSVRAMRAGNPYIHTWCVFDRDDHSSDRFNDAIQRAESATDLTAIWSNEAFELWYLLHFDYCQSSLNRREINDKLSRKIGRTYLKSDDSIYDDLMREGAEASIERAILNSEKLMADRRSPHRNPSLSVHRLIKELLRIKRELG